jgi:hypothetical protein
MQKKEQCFDGQHRLTLIKLYINGDAFGGQYLYIEKGNRRVFLFNAE